MFSKILDLYLDVIKCILEEVDSYTHIFKYTLEHVT